jgi:hypothetical protein
MSKRKNVMVLVLVFLLVAASVSAVAVGNRNAVERQDIRNQQIMTRQSQLMQTQRMQEVVDCDCDGDEGCESLENRTEKQTLKQAQQLLRRSLSQQKVSNVGGNGPAWAK